MKQIGFLSHVDQNLYLFRLPIMKALVSRGYRVYAIAPKGIYWHQFEKEGIVPISYVIDRKSINPLKELAVIKHLYHVLKPLQLDILHTFTAKPNIYGTFAGRKAGIPTIYNLVEGMGSFYIENTLKAKMIRNVMEFFYKRAFQLSDKTVFVNAEDADYMVQKNLIEREKVKVIRSVGVDTELFSPQSVDQAELDRVQNNLSPQGLPVVMMVARAIWHKGIKEFYAAADLLNKKAVFVLVGGTDEGNPSCADRSFLESGSVKWLGEKSDMVTLTAVSDIYVLPSYREGVPRTLMEAASMGKPIVTTDTTGCREVVDDGINGYLVPPRDISELVKKIQLLLENSEQRKTFGRRSREKAIKEFDVKYIVKQYLPLYGVDLV